MHTHAHFRPAPHHFRWFRCCIWQVPFPFSVRRKVMPYPHLWIMLLLGILIYFFLNYILFIIVGWRLHVPLSAGVHSPFQCVDTSSWWKHLYPLASHQLPTLTDLTERVVFHLFRESVKYTPCPVSSWGSWRWTIWVPKEQSNTSMIVLNCPPAFILRLNP